MLEDILLQVQKPGRYIGQEWNVSRKDFSLANIKFALCFPDLYELGMSNLGMRIIYGILNGIGDVVCERFFSPGADLEGLLRQGKAGFFSLESKKILMDFDIVGFSLGYELGYTNVLNILELGSIPLESSLRNHTHPLVIGGGPCGLNPEPMHEFFDLFVIGEAEEVILEIIDVYRKYKEKFRALGMTRQDLLILFSRIEGVYVPSLYEVTYADTGNIEKFKPKTEGVPVRIKKRFVKDLDRAFFPLDWLIPYIQIVHDRVNVEIMRGCPNRCRFCQARSQYFPFRFRNPQNILSIASDVYRRTGYEEVSLCGLSVSDYQHIEWVLEAMVDLFKERAVGVTLPSLKPRAYLGKLSSLIATIKKTGLTFAPEAATERLRNILGKDFDEGDFFKTIEKIYASGYRHVKLYFMIGLPREESRDLDGIIDFALRVSQLRRSAHNGPAWVNVSINTLIPKPHTPLQWLKVQAFDEIKYKQDYLRDRVKNRRLKFIFHNRYMSMLEAALSRGDRRLSRVIYSAFKQGARFDAWDEYFKFAYWQRAFSESNIDFNFYLQERSTDQFLPWDFLDVGISKEALLSEFEKTIAIE